MKILESSNLKYKYDPDAKRILIIDKIALITIDLSNSFPFLPPSINYDMQENKQLYYSLQNLEQIKFETIMKEHWHPSIKLLDIAEKSISYLNRNAVEMPHIPSILAKCSHNLANSKSPLLKLIMGAFLMKIFLIASLSFL